jgi:YD repeat-containing protein
MDAETLAGIPVMRVAGMSEAGCETCAAFRPAPRLDGSLLVDPEIHLPSPGMNVDIAYYYNASNEYNGPYGYGRTISHHQTAQASGSTVRVTMTRGNSAQVVYQDNGSGTYVPQTPGVFNTLVQDSGNGIWKETTPDGITTAYPLNTTGQICSMTYVEDAVGNRHTMTYASGRLQTVQDAVGRLVTFAYDGNNLLQSIEDWAQRRTTFAYDAVTASPKALLTTVTGPTGCQTAYRYATFTLGEAGTSSDC